MFAQESQTNHGHAKSVNRGKGSLDGFSNGQDGEGISSSSAATGAAAATARVGTAPPAAGFQDVQCVRSMSVGKGQVSAEQPVGHLSTVGQ